MVKTKSDSNISSSKNSFKYVEEENTIISKHILTNKVEYDKSLINEFCQKISEMEKTLISLYELYSKLKLKEAYDSITMLESAIKSLKVLEQYK